MSPRSSAERGSERSVTTGQAAGTSALVVPVEVVHLFILSWTMVLALLRYRALKRSHSQIIAESGCSRQTSRHNALPLVLITSGPLHAVLLCPRSNRARPFSQTDRCRSGLSFALIAGDIYPPGRDLLNTTSIMMMVLLIAQVLLCFLSLGLLG